ncbi:threonine ammonia-lyase, biosynthetic [bacterium]|nr:threonine ammonia-lyase, biosynthetic [bacterium]
MFSEIVKKIISTPVYEVAKESPLDKMSILSGKLNNTILLKREDQQEVFSFKLRGAYQKIHSLKKEELEKGVIAASAGNHAQGVALAAARLGCKATIVMPKPTASIKINNVRRLGAEVIVYGDNFDEACAYALNLAKEKGMSFIHPYDDPDVIAGQGTIAMELLRQNPEQLDAVFVPVGGGGLISGMASFIKTLRPEVKVFAVEPEGCACCKAAIDSQKRVVLDKVDLFAEGVAVKQLGELPFEILRKSLDGCVTVTPEEICAATRDIFNDTRAISETSGSVGLAGIKKYIRENNVTGKVFATVLSGANINFERLRVISQLAEMAEGEILFSAKLKEQPGSFRAFASAIDGHDVTEFNYRHSDDSKAYVFVGIRLAPGQKREDLYAKLNGLGYEICDLTGNLLAMTHVRYMVGGHANLKGEETLFQFEFPERAGTLKNFLDAMGSKWDITMFHYRNLGASVGRIFMGLMVPPEEKAQLNEVLKNLGYSYTVEKNNPAYECFLR